MNQSILLTQLLFSTIGLGFFVYGKKQRAPVPLICGLSLMLYPYFTSSLLLLFTIGIALTAIPYFFRQ